MVSESRFLVSESGSLVSEAGALVSEAGFLVSEAGHDRITLGIQVDKYALLIGLETQVDGTTMYKVLLLLSEGLSTRPLDHKP